MDRSTCPRAGLRSVILVLVVVTLAISTMGSASARSLRIRSDGNDTDSRADVRRVISDLTTSTVYMRVDFFREFRRWDHFVYLIVRLDTSGNRYFDRVLEIYPGSHSFICLLEKAARDGDPTEAVGDRRAVRPTDRSVACRLPRSWFPRIHRAVRFYVVSAGDSPIDRAPNRGLYRWL